MTTAEVTSNLIAEVKCRTCGDLRWIQWDARHAGRDEKDSRHASARCPCCPAGTDKTDYTGRTRNLV